MVKLALFLEVVWAGSSLEAFRAEVPGLQPQVLALDFVDLGKVPERLVPELLSATGAAHENIQL